MLFFDHVTVSAVLFGDLAPGTYFVRERDMSPCGDILPCPCVLRKKTVSEWERVFSSDLMTNNIPSTGTLDPNEHVIVLH